jgi:hypothetical protein
MLLRFHLPDELLDMIFWYLRPKEIEHRYTVPPADPSPRNTVIKETEGDKANLSAWGSVCRHWRQIALPHLFHGIKVTYRSVLEIHDPVAAKDYRVDMDGRTEQFDYWNARHWAILYRHQSLFSLYTFLYESPSIQPLVKRLRLDACPGYRSLQLSIGDGFTAIYHLTDNVMKASYMEYNYDTHAGLFFLTICLLPSLQELSLHHVCLTQIPIALQNQGPVLPGLKRLFIWGEKDLHVCNILHYFRKVRFARIEGLRNPSILCKSHNESTALEVTTLSIEPYAHIPKGFYSLLRSSPSINSLRYLDLGNLLPDEPGFMEQ